MPLPQKVIEQLGRDPARTPGWSGKLLMFSSTLLFLALAVYVGIIFGYRPAIDTRVKDLDDRSKAFDQDISTVDLDRIVVFYSQLVNLKILLDGHVVNSRLFDWLEQHTHTGVFFTKFAARSGGRDVALSGVAQSTDGSAAVAIEQLLNFERSEEVQSVALKNLTLGQKNAWNFDLELSFAPDLLVTPSPVPPPAAETGEEAVLPPAQP